MIGNVHNSFIFRDIFLTNDLKFDSGDETNKSEGKLNNSKLNYISVMLVEFGNNPLHTKDRNIDDEENNKEDSN